MPPDVKPFYSDLGADLGAERERGRGGEGGGGRRRGREERTMLIPMPLVNYSRGDKGKE